MGNLLKMERYQLCRHRLYWYGMAGVFLLGFFTADTYVSDLMGTAQKEAASLSDIFNGMIYDSTFLMIIISGLLAFVLGQEFSNRTVNLEIYAGYSRKSIFISKLFIYLPAFNIMALVYPAAGCLRELPNFGFGQGLDFLKNAVMGGVYSCLFNSAVFLIAVLFCFWLKSAVKAAAAASAVTFVLSLYLGYGLMLKLPVSFLPIYQIREAVCSTAFFLPYGILVGTVWTAALIWVSWRSFVRCDLK